MTMSMHRSDSTVQFQQWAAASSELILRLNSPDSRRHVIAVKLSADWMIIVDHPAASCQGRELKEQILSRPAR